MSSLLYRAVREGEAFRPPTHAHSSDAGIDLAISRYIQVYRDQTVQLPTNIAVAIPEGSFGLVIPRSSTLWKLGLLVSHGMIDPGYRGEVMIVAKNLSSRAVTIQEGDRIAQLLVLPVWRGKIQEVEVLPPGEERGEAGFGSTGR